MAFALDRACTCIAQHSRAKRVAPLAVACLSVVVVGCNPARTSVEWKAPDTVLTDSGLRDGGEGDAATLGDGGTAPADVCLPNPDDPGCPEICNEVCNDLDDDCDGSTDEGDAVCALDHGSAVCLGGTCILASCDAGFRDCDGQPSNGCEADLSNVATCGDCRIACEFDNTMAVCIDGACETAGCVAPYLDCEGDDGVCETFGSTLSDCGGCDQPCVAMHSTPSCEEGACTVESCDIGWGDCNGLGGDGCEADHDSSARHCGGCAGQPGNEPCEGLVNVVASTCVGGRCRIGACSPGFDDCNRDTVDGCERSIAQGGPCCDANIDSDGDGSDDCADECPTDPDKSARGDCGCFVSDANDDGDAAANCIDGCPFNPDLTTACEPKRKRITIQGSQVPSPQTAFPVLIRIQNDAALASHAEPSGRDITFEDPAGNPLSFERSAYDSVAGSLSAWVVVDLTGGDQDIYLHYGDGDVAEKSTPAAVWDGNYRGVWHLDGGAVAQRVVQTGIAEGGTGTVACPSGTILNYRSTYGSNAPSGCPVACGGCTLGGTSCSQRFDNATCGDCSNGNAKTSTLEILCGVTAAAPDSTGNGFDGSNRGAAQVAGKIGNGGRFANLTYIDLPPGALGGINTQVTASFWAFGDAAVQPAVDHLFSSSGPGDGYVINSHVPWVNGRIYWDANDSNTGCCTAADRIDKMATDTETEGRWNHYVMTKDTTEGSGVMRIYLNGVLWHSATGTAEVMNGDQATVFRLGSNVGGGANYTGIIDEFRISRIERGADWIRTEYNNQNAPTAFVAVGTEEDP